MKVTSLILYQFQFSLNKSIIRHCTKYTSKLPQWTRIKSMENMPLSRDNPIITKLDTQIFRSIFTPELNVLITLFRNNYYELRIAGGAVRDMLMGLNPKDLDFATTATPEQMKKLFEMEKIRMINTKGEKHGTITARIDKANFEVTTLRVDVVTDGRRADVQFTTNWKLDANRRDLTINSMFLDFDGNVYDYFFGYEDLQKKRVVFVGDAETRIQEDFLRILRYFRFYGRIADHPDNHEQSIINVIKANVDGMVRVSGERIWSEWSKILEGNFAMELTLKMIDCNLTKFIGLPENLDIENFKYICSRANRNNLKLHPVTMISTMLKSEEDVWNIFVKLRWPAYHRDLALFIVNNRDMEGPSPLYPFQLLLLKFYKTKNIHEYICELIKYRGTPELLEQFENWTPPRFPVTGHDLKPFITHAKLMALTMQALKEIWLKDDCKTTADDLVKQVPNIVIALQNKIASTHKK